MKALLWLYHVFFLACCYCAVFQIQRHSQISRSVIPSIPSMSSSIDIPWLVSMPGNCQGIVLNQWLILSTANCLKKMELPHMDISGVNDPESIPHGQKICLHPRFDVQDKKDPVKADIGMVILEEPISGDNIPLSDAPNISLKSCSKCQYRDCEVFEYQSSKKLGTTRVKKVSVQLLDFSTCHHQHSYLGRTEGFCIQSQPRHDCWIQQASPVLCLLKNHWELVGFIHKTSRICQNPTVIVRTAPYLTWIKQFIKASKKLLTPSTALHCRTLHESEHVPQIKHGYNYPPTIALPMSSTQILERGISVSPQIEQYIKTFPTIFNFRDTSSFTDTQKALTERKQTSQAEQRSASPVAGLTENVESHVAQFHQDTPSSSTWNLVSTAKPLAQLISDPVTSNTSLLADTVKSWDYPMEDPVESFDKIMADVVKQWSPSEDEVMEPLNSQKASTTCEPKTTTVNREEYSYSLKAYTTGPQNEHITTASAATNFPSSHSRGPWTFLSSGEIVDTSSLALDTTTENRTSESPLISSTWIPLPSGTVEPWSSSSKYYGLTPQDQSVTNPGPPQTSPGGDVDKLQLIPVTNMGEPSAPSKMITYAPLPSDFGSKITMYQVRHSAIPSQGQSSLKAMVQPTTDNES